MLLQSNSVKFEIRFMQRFCNTQSRGSVFDDINQTKKKDLCAEEVFNEIYFKHKFKFNSLNSPIISWNHKTHRGVYAISNYEYFMNAK